MQATAGAEQITEARAGVETSEDQKQHIRGVHAGTRTAGPSSGNFGESLAHISQRRSKSTPSRVQWQTSGNHMVRDCYFEFFDGQTVTFSYIVSF